jgi:hypothetical protein
VNSVGGTYLFNTEEYTRFRDYRIYPSTAGLFRPQRGGFRSVGTATFVSIGKINGLLTCEHVIDAIANETRIDLALFPVRQAERLISLNVREHCDFVKLGPSENQEDGPDLGFLRLPIPFFSSISALVSVKSMERGRVDAVAAAEPSEKSVTLVTGMIAEWTPDQQTTMPFTVSGLTSIGHLTTDRIKRGEHDLFRFRPDPDENFRPPSSYEGTSGGGLWRVYPQPDDGGPTAYRLIGVAFYQTPDREIICHGQASVYGRLFDAVRDKWTEAR